MLIQLRRRDVRDGPCCWTEVECYPSFFVLAILSATVNPVYLELRFCAGMCCRNPRVWVDPVVCANVRFGFLVADIVGTLMLLPDDCCVK
jgi:hypothetical protein